MAKRNRKLKWGMVGGGPGAFIGDVHRKAAWLDGAVELVAGAFSSDPAKSRQMGDALSIDPRRIYDSYTQMAAEESRRPEGERIDFVSIVTPNLMHYPIGRAFLDAGFHVVCEKPMTFNLKEARALAKRVDAGGNIFAVTYNYTGYPLVKLARDMVRQGDLGEIRKIVVQYPQGWLAAPVDNKQANWRTDPQQSGAAGCIGDIGTHALSLAEYITGLKVTEVCADLTTFVKGRLLDDDAMVLLRFEQGAKGLLHASQIAIGEENNLAIWVHGSKRTLEWHQEHPDSLYVKRIDGLVEVWRRGNDKIARKSAAAGRATRLPFGHPEGFIEAFANIYVNVAETIRSRIADRGPNPLARDFPTVEHGLRGMLFVDAVLKSARSKTKWIRMPMA